MNRRKPVKKEYFTFLSTISKRWLVFSGIFLILVIAGLIIQALLANSEMAGEDIAAVLAMIIIPLLILFTSAIVFEKTTGLSLIAGVEWIGKSTLALFDWGISSLQSSLGIEQKKARPGPRNQSTSASAATQSNVAGTILATKSVKEPVFSAFQEPEPAQSETESSLTLSKVEQAVEGLHVDFTSEPLLIDSHEQEVSVDGSTSNFLEEQTAETVDSDSQQTRETESGIEQQIDTGDAQLQERSDMDEANQHAHDQDVIFNEFEIELKSFYLEKDNLDSKPSNELYEKSSSKDYEQRGVESDSQSGNEYFSAQVAPKKTDYMIDALYAAKQKHTAPLSSEPSNTELGNHDNRLYAPPNTTDIIINTLQDAAKETVYVENTNVESSKLTEQLMDSENSSVHPSLLDQAEKTAVSLLSAFTEKFSKSFTHPHQASFKLPSVDLLEAHQQSIKSYSTEELDEMSRTVERVLKDYKVIAEVAGAYPGPIITRFELSLAPGVKVSRVSGLAKDLARAMLVTSVRVVDIIEGTPYIGLEIPNQERELVSFREIIESEQFQQAASPITLALGKDVSGQTVVSDLAKMPHLLVAGTTGSGKSVAINTMILSMLYKATPDQVRMIMIDPKMLELSIYEGIPHLLTPVVTDMKEAQNGLRWAVAEMERRYKLMSKVGVRNLAGFNQKIEEAEARGEPIRDPLFQLIEPLQEGQSFPVLSTLPNIVIVIDELADMMMIVGKKVEELIARLAQKARAAGIHLILATQRPSVDVLTGLIKANVPTRISFQVSSRIDSRTILDQGGAEALLGNGDMLFLPSGTSVPKRSHGAFVADDEVHAIVNYLKSQGATNYITGITQEVPEATAAMSDNASDEVDEFYNDAVSFVMESGRASISSVQRRFKVGYNRAARMIDQMEDENIVSEPEGNGSRRVLNKEE